MRQQTELFFASVLHENRSILELLDAHYTFLNQRLAEHYGIPNIYGPQFRRVILTDPNRRGLLGQGSILTVTSYPNRTSVVQRGKWVLENLLGTPPPPPPRGCSEPSSRGAKMVNPSRCGKPMEQHRTECGLRLLPRAHGSHWVSRSKITMRSAEWRSEDAGLAIDVSGELPDGAAVRGSRPARQAMATGHRDEYVSTVTEKLLTYALGRGLEYYDQPAVRSIHERPRASNYSMTSLMIAIVSSMPISDEKEFRPMILTKKALARRTFLRGVGTAVACHFSNPMVPALSLA